MEAVERFLEPDQIPENAVLLDARPQAAHLAGHIPGSRPIDLVTAKFATREPESIERLNAVLSAALSAAGLEPGRPAVVYDGGPETRAARTAWALEYAGLEVGLLRGGFPAWVAAGKPVTGEPTAWTPTSFALKARADLLATAGEIEAGLGSGSFTLLDARGGPEYRGETAPAGTPRRGRIPGAVNLEWTRMMDERGYKADADLERELQGVPGDREVVVYCQSGARSAVLYHALKARGLSVRNYIGSAGEWLSSPDLPVETGTGKSIAPRR